MPWVVPRVVNLPDSPFIPIKLILSLSFIKVSGRSECSGTRESWEPVSITKLRGLRAMSSFSLVLISLLECVIGISIDLDISDSWYFSIFLTCGEVLYLLHFTVSSFPNSVAGKFG